MPSKKRIRAKKTPRWMKSPRVKQFMRMTKGNGAGVVAALAICVLAAAMLIAGESSQQTNLASADASAQTAVAQAWAKNAAPAALSLSSPTDANDSMGDSAKATAGKSTPVTITGCLERADEAFRLKNTSGADAPKVRSWKSGFLKKGPASIDLVDASNRAKLRDHVGQRVSVTGTLVNREMQVRSMQRVGASCGTSRVKI
jgi:hypothetical protein